MKVRDVTDIYVQNDITILKKLDPADVNAAHRSECLAGTRTGIIDFMIGWLDDRDPERLKTSVQ